MSCKKQIFNGFTIVEITVVVAISSILLLAITSFFSQTVKTTMKGRDNLDTAKSVSLLLRSIKTDMRSLSSIQTNGTVIKIKNSEDISSLLPYSDMLVIGRRLATITYSLSGMSPNKYVERMLQTKNGVTKKSKFCISRIKTFNVAYMQVENKVGSDRFWSGMVMLKIRANSDDKKFPSKSTEIITAFFPEKIMQSDWNYLDI